MKQEDFIILVNKLCYEKEIKFNIDFKDYSYDLLILKENEEFILKLRNEIILSAFGYNNFLDLCCLRIQFD